jgi:hypothetical protein
MGPSRASPGRDAPSETPVLKTSLPLLLLLAAAATARADRDDHRDHRDHDRGRSSDRDRHDDRDWDRDRRSDRDRDWDRDRRSDRDWDRDRDRDRDRGGHDDWDRDDRDRDDWDRRDRGRWGRDDRRFDRSLSLIRFVVRTIDGRHYRDYDCGCRHSWHRGHWAVVRRHGCHERVWVPGHYERHRGCSHHRH